MSANNIKKYFNALIAKKTCAGKKYSKHESKINYTEKATLNK